MELKMELINEMIWKSIEWVVQS